MEPDSLASSVAYCGLVCRLCFLAARCDGCKTTNNRCDRDCSDVGCFQKNCCVKKGFSGCWECDALESCVEGIYAQGDRSKVKAFAIAIREDGMEGFTGNVRAALKRGLSVEKGKDFDNHTIAEVLAMLRQ